jgi:hypothetical protein
LLIEIENARKSAEAVGGLAVREFLAKVAAEFAAAMRRDPSCIPATHTYTRVLELARRIIEMHCPCLL